MQPGRDRPTPQAPTQPSFDFTIEAPERSQVPRAVEELHFVLHDIKIVGAKTIPAESFLPLYKSLLGQEVTVSNVLDVADAIEDRYRRAGYILTHAYVPPQRVNNGVFTINVVEGYVASVAIEGGDSKTQAKVREYLQPVLDERPLTLAVMERSLLLSNDLAGVVVAGVLRPSPNVPGASELAVTIAQTAWNGGLALDNRESNFQGNWNLGGDVEANGLVFAGDQLGVSYSTSPNMLQNVSGSVNYKAPIGSNGMMGRFIITVTHGEPGASLQQFNLITDSVAIGPRLSYPLIRTRAETLQLDGGFTVQQAHVEALGGQLSNDEWRVADLGATYARALLGGSFSGSFDSAEGLGIFGATPDGSPSLSHPGAATEFTKLSGTFRYIRPIYGPLSIAVAGQGQYAFAPLVAGEQITFGGAAIGRGYDPGAVTGDEGAGGSFELRYDERLPQFHIETLEPYTYYDTGKVWNFHPNQGGGASVASAGVGLRAFLPYSITGDVELSRTLRAVPGSNNGQKATKIFVDAAVRF